MINREKHPVAWAMLMYELEDASEHLAELIKEMLASGDFSEEEFKIHLAHVYSHLNRAWNGRCAEEWLADEQWQAASAFPGDLEPL